MLEAFNRELANGASPMTAYYRTMQNASKSAVNLAKNAGKAGVDIASIPKASKAAEMGLKALNVAMNVLATVAITAIITGITKMIQAKEKARKAAIDNINAYKEEQSLLEEQAEKYKEISEALEKENLSVDETVSKKEELLGIQNTLVETFGDEAEGIDLVNGKYREQLALLDKLSKQNASKIVTENKDEFEDAKKEIEKIRTYSLGALSKWSSYDPQTDDEKKVIEYIESYSDLFETMLGGETVRGERVNWINFNVKANVEDADKVLHDFAEDLRKFGDENNIDVSGILENVGEQLNNTWTDKLTEYKEIYDEYSTALIMANDDVRPMYKEAIDAVEEYNKALATGEGYETAKTKLKEVMSEVEALTAGIEDSEEMWRVFQEIFDKQGKSRESEIEDLKKQFGLHYNDKTLETFFANEDIDMERFKRIAAVTENAVEAIRMYHEEVSKVQEEAPIISDEKLDQAKSYRDELGKLYDALALLRSGNATASDIYGFVEEFPGLSEYVGDLELLEEKIQELVNERLVLLREQYNGVIGEEALRNLAEYSVRMESITRNIDSTASTINTITSAYQSLNEAIEEYNENGHVSLKTLEQIMKLEPRHLAALLDKNGKIKSNTDAYKELVKIELKEYEISARKTYDLAREQNAEAIKQAAEDYGKNRISIDEYQKIIGELGLDDWRVTKKFIDSAWDELEKDPEGFLGGSGLSSSTSSTFDWIEVKINSIKEAVEELKEVADDPFASWADRDSALQSVIDKLKSSKDDYDKAYKTYLSEAENVGLGSTYKTLVEEGKFDIESFKDDPNYEKIQKYQELYEKAQEMAKLRDSVGNEVNSAVQDNFDLIISEFDSKLSHYENTANLIESQLANAESRGLIATQQYYETLKGIESGKKDLLDQQLVDLKKALSETDFETDSEGWSNLTNEIESTELALQESTNAMQEFNNEIRQIDWDLFDFAREQEGKLMDEADFMIDLLDSAKMFSEVGEITAEGLATMGLHASNYNAYLEQSIEYAEELAKRQVEIDAGSTDRAIIERRNELLELQQESILASENELESIKSLVSEGIEKQKESFSELISQYTEALDIQKD